MTERNETTLGTRGLPYGTKAVEAVEAWLLTRLAGGVSENPRHQGFAAKPLPEIDALAELTGADA